MTNRVFNKKKEILKKHEERLNYLISACESPLESLFLLEIFNQYDTIEDTKTRFLTEEIIPEEKGFDKKLVLPEAFHFRELGCFFKVIGIEIDDNPIYCSIFPQYEVETDLGKKRLDLAVLCYHKNNRKKIIEKFAIECDGHEFHSTREQKKRDDQRARALGKEGWRTLRYSGSEIFENLEGSVTNLIDLLIHNTHLK